jgi:hypothetical protein
MTSRRILGRSACCALAAWVAAALLAASFVGRAESRDGKDDQPQVLTRGPIHEAFAAPVTFDARPGPTAPRLPPPLVEELPPEEKPEGDNVAWIPGYYQWDDERKGFIWVSGFWRVMPPGRKWIPGYWNKQEDGGAQWVSGYWAPAEQAQVEYLPPPPATLENGPQNEAPAPNHIWTPGTWVWRETRYLWRPGFYVAASPGWIWMPAYYAYTPCGYVYVDGYWDYVLPRRGVIFAPCYWSPWAFRPVYVYRPTVCIDVAIVTDHFFCRTGYSTYFFGDYYGGTYVGLGFTPWFSFHYARGGGYCPVYAYNSWYFRANNPRWEIQLRAGYDYRFRNLDARPPRTYVAQQNIVNINKTTIINNTTIVNKTVVAKPISQIASDAAEKKDAPMRFTKIDANQQRRYREQGKEAQQLVGKRLDLERDAARQARAEQPRTGGGQREVGNVGQQQNASPRQPLKLEMPKSPIAARPPADKPGGTGGKASDADDAKVGNRPPERPGVGGSRTGRPAAGKPGSGSESAGKPGDAGSGTTGDVGAGKPSATGPGAGPATVGGRRPGVGTPGSGARGDATKPGGTVDGSTGAPSTRPGGGPGAKPGGGSDSGSGSATGGSGSKPGGGSSGGASGGASGGNRPGSGSGGSATGGSGGKPGGGPAGGGSGGASGGNRPGSGSGGSATGGSGGKPGGGSSGGASSGNRPGSGGSGTPGGGRQPTGGSSGSSGKEKTPAGGKDKDKL